jgi:hypothetical protein
MRGWSTVISNMPKPHKDHRRLRLKFHGRIIDHLGIQMYESPIAAVAELVANAWDADAETVDIKLPTKLAATAEIVISDKGVGMTFADCENHYLNVGYAQRANDPRRTTHKKHRPLLGRKGIGKFAGFGIAEVISVDTISEETGEHIVFDLDINQLRKGEYVVAGGGIDVRTYEGPDRRRAKRHGTTIRLRRLKLAQRPRIDVFRTGLSRRFLLHQRVTDFVISVNSGALPRSARVAGVEFTFPTDYREDERPTSILNQDAEGWAVESLANGETIRWRFDFYEEPIRDEDLRGLSVFAHGKLAQMPFFFNLSGGLSGQHGQQYLSGQVEADYLDELSDDVITTERQRINWGHPASAVLEKWGQERTKDLLAIWKERRAEEKIRLVTEKIADFGPRLVRLKKHERRPVEMALKKLASIETLTSQQFSDLGGAILTSWEQGRLRDLITDIAARTTFTTADFIDVLTELQVLEALNLAEVVRTKAEAIAGLERIIEARALENEIRNYIAERPWLLDQKWETFRREAGLQNVFDKAAGKAGLTKGAKGRRIDLALRSNEHLLVVEFMRPGETADWDHLDRIERYVVNVRDLVEAESTLGITRVTGLVVADRLEKSGEVKRKIEQLGREDITAYSWPSLVKETKRRWQDFLEILVQRAPNDPRLRDLANGR